MSKNKPTMINIVVRGYLCKRCGHQWVPRNTKDRPRVCPSCKSPYWDREKKGNL